MQPSQDWKTFHYILTNPRIADYRETVFVARIFQDGRGLHVLHSKQGEWPKVLSPGNADVKKDDDITYTAFVHRFVDGAWWVYPLAMEYHNGPGETSDTERLENWYNKSLYNAAGPVYTAGPIRDGELIGFSVVHGMQRGELGNMEIPGTLHERSGVQYINAQLRGDFDLLFMPPTHVDPPTPPVPPPTDVPPPGEPGHGGSGGDHNAAMESRVRALEAALALPNGHVEKELGKLRKRVGTLEPLVKAQGAKIASYQKDAEQYRKYLPALIRLLNPFGMGK